MTFCFEPTDKTNLNIIQESKENDKKI